MNSARESYRTRSKRDISNHKDFFSLLVQALSVMAVANITVIGYAIANQTAGILILGALIDLFTLVIFIMVDVLLLSPLYFRTASLRKQLGPESLEFITVFLATYYRPSLPSEIEKLTLIGDIKERTRKLHRLFIPSRTRLSKRVVVLCFPAVLQLVSIPLLVNWFGWRMF